MRALVVYETMYGNGRQVAEQVADGLAETMTVDLRSVEDARPLHLADYQLVVIGGPTHAFGMSTPESRAQAHGRQPSEDASTGIREWLPWLGTEYAGALAVFDTRSGRSRRRLGCASGAASRQLKRDGYRALDRKSFLVGTATGPLRDGELYQARQWGTELGIRMRTGAHRLGGVRAVRRR